MASGLRNLLVRIGADMSQMKAEMKKAQQSLNDFKSNVSGIVKGVGIALATLGVGSYIKDATNTAMKFEAAISQVTRLMGASSADFLKWANTSALAFNMSKSDAVQYGATFANIISSFSTNTKQTSQYTQDLLKATSVVASKTGRTMDDALERIRSGMLGNTEAVEDLGIFVNVAMIQSTKAFSQFANGKSWDQLDFRTQQTIRYFAILEQAATKYGVEVGNNVMSATARLSAQLGDLKLKIGQAFLPIWETVIPALSTLVGWLIKAATVVGQFFQVLFGKEPAKQAQTQAKAAGQVASSVGGVGNAYKSAGKEAKKAKKEQQGFLASFDEINSIQDNKSDDSTDGGKGAGSGGGGTSSPAISPPSMDTSGLDAAFGKISEKVRAVAEAIRGFFKGMSDFVKEHKDVIIAALAGVGAAFITFIALTKGATLYYAIMSNTLKAGQSIVKGLGLAFQLMTGPVGLIILAVAAAVAAFVYFYRTNEKFRGVVDSVLNAIKDAAVYLWKNVLVPLGSFLATVFSASWDVVKKVADSFYKNVLIPLGAFLSDLWKNVLVPLGTFLGSAFKAYWENLSTVISFLYTNVIKPLATFLTGLFLTGITSAFKTIGEQITNLRTVLNGIVTFISGVFSGNWGKAWDGIKEIFRGVWNSFETIAKGPINAIISMINYLISAMNKISIDVPKWVPGVGGKSFGINIPTIPALAKGGITNGPTLAMIGDNPGGQEVVSPLDKLTDIVAGAVANGMMAASQFIGGSPSQNGEIVIQIDGTTVARVLNPYTSKETSRIGKAMIRTT